MKNNSTSDKYGFKVQKVSKTFMQFDIHYYNEETNTNAYFSYEFDDIGLLKMLRKRKELENKFKSCNIAQNVAFIINSSTFAWRRQFDEEFKFDILEHIPDSLILNNEAMQELLTNLNQENKHLVVFVAEYIKDRRKQIEEEKQADLEANKEIYDKYDQLKEEFKF